MFDATLDVSGLPCDTSPFTPVDGAPLDDIAPASALDPLSWPLGGGEAE